MTSTARDRQLGRSDCAVGAHRGDSCRFHAPRRLQLGMINMDLVGDMPVSTQIARMEIRDAEQARIPCRHLFQIGGFGKPRELAQRDRRNLG
jgi:hypothetical protein